MLADGGMFLWLSKQSPKRHGWALPPRLSASVPLPSAANE
jgi:hypothetical protein